MSTTDLSSAPADPRVWLTATDCRLEEVAAIVGEATDLTVYPAADSVSQNVLVYDSNQLRGRITTTDGRSAVQAELARALMDGPGIIVFKRAFADLSVVDRASDVFDAMIADQRASGAASGDHFAKPGANDRVWNALEKLAVRDPEVFAAYYANDIIALVSTAWLGPAYQITSQVNVVNPGGAAQTGHRDYHLGFMSVDQAARFPAHVDRLSPVLTLQGAVAHRDMPVESGPTVYLPYSQKYEPGYLAAALPEFREYFEANHVQLPLEKGDAAFFNPALIHAAGHNRSTEIRRMATLLQVSSAFGRAMESVDRHWMSNALFPTLLLKASRVTAQTLRNVIAACAEGYSFTTNLDRDQPVDGLAPQTQAELLWQAVAEGWAPATFQQQLEAHSTRRSTSEP
jgi:ectoine hydroxylase-related dioxygenase (phytanoyl-CoA dioxygenase family)